MKLEFSKNGKARILITTLGNTMYLDKIKTNIKIGEEFNGGKFEHDLELIFCKTESIDVLIKKLNDIKNNIILNSAS